MANSRLEKIGTIYSRTKGLIETGALTWKDRPLWYDLYEAFPPKEEPRFDRISVKIPLKKIFYEDDKIRALFHYNNKRVGAVNLSNNKTPSLTQRFIYIYKRLNAQYEGKMSEDKLYGEAIEVLNREQQVKKEEDEFVSLSTAFKEIEDKKNKRNVESINIKDILNT